MRLIFILFILSLSACHLKAHKQSLQDQIEQAKHITDETGKVKHEYEEIVNTFSSSYHTEIDSHIAHTIRLSGTICQKRSCHAIVTIKEKNYFVAKNSKLLNEYSVSNISQNEIDLANAQSTDIIRVKL